MEGLLRLDPATEFRGIGGTEMTGRGLCSLFPMEELSLMGIWEVLPQYRALKRRIAQTAQAVLDCRPDALVSHSPSVASHCSSSTGATASSSSRGRSTSITPSHPRRQRLRGSGGE